MSDRTMAYRIFIELGVQPDGTFERGVTATGQTQILGDGDMTNDALVYAHAANAALQQSKAMAEAASWLAQWRAECDRLNELSARMSRKVH